ncbi:MAG: hypothetical protein MN733_34950 [Nitrososphaera sp.]|nr:hypothetical protein [Nitrososphaera sp.]
MSLIEEALRRIQDPAVTSEQKTASPSPTPKQKNPDSEKAPAKQTDAPAHSWSTHPYPPQTASQAPGQNHPLTWVALAVFLLTSVLIISGVFWLGKKWAGLDTKVQAASQNQTVVSRTSEEKAEIVDQTSSLSSPPLLPLKKKVARDKNPQLIVNGVIEGLGEPYAVIDDAILGIGDQIDGMTVVAIGKGRVTLRNDAGAETTLRLVP